MMIYKARENNSDVNVLNACWFAKKKNKNIIHLYNDSY